MLQVLIVGSSKYQECEARCGVDWSQGEWQELAAKQLKATFGDQVIVKYFDLADLLASQQHPDLISRIKVQSLSLPLLALNNKPRISGYFNMRMLMDAIEAELEINHG